MKFLRRHHLVKQKKFQPQQSVSIKHVRLVAGGLIGLVVMALPITLFVSHHSLAETKALRQELVTQAKQKERDEQENQGERYRPLLESFLDPFIQSYLTLSTSNEALEERRDVLSDYVSDNVLELTETVNMGVTQTLVSKELYDVYAESDFDVAVYKVVYQVESPVEAEREVKKDGKVTIEKYVAYTEMTQETLLNIPFKSYKDNKFKVVSLPYFTNEPSLIQEEVDELGVDQATLDSVSAKKTVELEEFIEQFLTKYTQSDEADMQFYMTHPESLTGFTVSSHTVECYKKDGQYIAFVDVQLVDAETKNRHQEKMTLFISKKEKTFNVDQLNHYLGGI